MWHSKSSVSFQFSLTKHDLLRENLSELRDHRWLTTPHLPSMGMCLRNTWKDRDQLYEPVVLSNATLPGRAIIEWHVACFRKHLRFITCVPIRERSGKTDDMRTNCTCFRNHVGDDMTTHAIYTTFLFVFANHKLWTPEVENKFDFSWQSQCVFEGLHYTISFARNKIKQSKFRFMQWRSCFV